MKSFDLWCEEEGVVSEGDGETKDEDGDGIEVVTGAKAEVEERVEAGADEEVEGRVEAGADGVRRTSYVVRVCIYTSLSGRPCQLWVRDS